MTIKGTLKWAGRSLAAFALTAAVLTAGCTSTRSTSTEAGSPEYFRDRWGVKLVGVRLTAAAHMLDFRYRVLDAEKAAPLFRRKSHPSLLHEKTGLSMSVHSPAKLGPMRTSDPPKADRTYWILFVNRNKIVKAGDAVTVIIGNFEANKIIVE